MGFPALASQALLISSSIIPKLWACQPVTPGPSHSPLALPFALLSLFACLPPVSPPVPFSWEASPTHCSLFPNLSSIPNDLESPRPRGLSKSPRSPCPSPYFLMILHQGQAKTVFKVTVSDLPGRGQHGAL